MTWLRHPGFRQLSALADGAFAPGEDARIREHLAGCARCRRELAFIRKLDRAVEEIPGPRPPEGGFQEILSRREAGERRILPVGDPSPVASEGGSLQWLALAFGLLVTAGAIVFLPVGEATAGASELRLSSGMPRAGAVDVEYRTPSELAGEERLRLRARYRLAEDPWPREAVGRPLESELRRDGAGRFRGDLRLPEAAVYAAFSVEDLEGRRVDVPGARPWEFVARDASGRPTFEALVQRIRALEIVRWADALETARQATELHPERIHGWFLRLFYEGLVLDRTRRDSVIAYHRERFSAFERRVAHQSQPSVEDLAALVDYARSLEEGEAKERWLARLEAVHPTHRIAVQERVVAAGAAYAADPRGLQATLEAEWERSGPADESLLHAGFRAALGADTPEAIRAWAHRIERYAPHWTSRVASEMAAVPELRREAMAGLRRELAELERVGPDVRALDRSVPEHRAASRDRAAHLLASLGRALAAEGEMDAARDTLRLAARWSWDPELFSELAELHLIMADTAGAARLLAFAAADPLVSATEGDGPPGRFGPSPNEASGGALVDADSWTTLVDEGRAELRRRVLERAEDRRIPPAVRVADETGADHALEEVLAPGPTLLVFWSPRSYPALNALPRLREASALLTSAGVRIVAVSAREPAPETAPPPWRGAFEPPLYFDAHGEVADALDLWATPRFVVVDGNGHVRSRDTALENALRHALVLAAD